MNIIWQYLDKKEAAISALKDYHSMKYIIEHTNEEIADVTERMTSLGGSTISDMPKNKAAAHAAESKMIKAIDQIDVLRERYRQAVEYMEWFEPAWKALTEDERFVLQTFYWESDQKQIDAVYDICDYFLIERSSAYNKKNRAVQHLALLLYGK